MRCAIFTRMDVMDPLIRVWPRPPSKRKRSGGIFARGSGWTGSRHIAIKTFVVVSHAELCASSGTSFSIINFERDSRAMCILDFSD